MSVTTTSDDAFDAYTAALDLALAQQDGALELLRRAVEADDGFALAWALLGLQQRATGDMSGGTESLTTAGKLANGLSERERSHLQVLERFTAFDVLLAESAIHAHLQEWPRDAVIVMQAHYLYNLFDPRPDRDQRMLALNERLAPSYGDDWFMLGELAFAAEENAGYVRARDLAERSLAVNAMNGTAAHPLAHVYLETADLDAGSAWLTDWLSAWEKPSAFACHLTWHLALLRLAIGDANDAVRLLADIVGFVDRSLGVLADGASLAWRLHVDNAPAELPWGQLVTLPDRPGFTFSNAHHVLALAGIRDADGLRTYAETLDRLATNGHPTAGRCAQFSRGLADLSVENTTAAADRLVELWPEFRSFGGSHAQTEVFEDAAIAAVEAAGRHNTASQLLRARLSRRPSARDQRWLGRII